MNADIIKRRIERNVKQAFADYQADAEVKTKFGDPVIGYLTGMKEKDQLLLVLKYQENLREADIASILHMPRGTVSSRINTLLKKIREDMNGEGKSCD